MESRGIQFHETIWDITEAVVAAPTWKAIDERVCERLQEIEGYDAVWVCSQPPEPDLRASTGCDPDDIEQLLDEPDDESPEQDDSVPWIEAADRRTTVVETLARFDPAWTDEVVLGCVPLIHRRINYGILNVTTQRAPDALRADLDVLGSFGRTVGHAHAATEIQKQGNVFQQAIERADPAIAILDPDGTVEYVNAAFESVLGYGKAEAVGTRIRSLLDDESIGALVENSETGRTEIRHERPDGRRVHVDFAVATVPVEGGTSRKSIAVAADITPLKEHEQRLEVLNRILRHNLRNDLNAVRGRVSHVMRELTDENRARLETAVENIDALVEVGEKVRYVEEHIGSTTASDIHEVDIVKTLCRVIERVEREHPDAEVELDAPGTCRALGNDLEVAFREVVTNAVEHNPSETPRVAVRVRPATSDDEFTVIEVADDGPGIPDHERTVIQKERETALDHGSSIGLWLVKWIVTYAGGRLDIGPSDMGGSVVRFRLRCPDRDG